MDKSAPDERLSSTLTVHQRYVAWKQRALKKGCRKVVAGVVLLRRMWQNGREFNCLFRKQAANTAGH